MWHELNLGGVYLPPILAYMAAAFVLYLPVRYGLDWLGVWRWTWNPSLAQACLYVSILGLLAEFL